MRRAVWVSTFGLYNAGALLGRWYDLHNETVPETVEEFIESLDADNQAECRGKYAFDIGEELWCFDVEGFPKAVEMSPSRAQEIHDEIVEQSEHVPEAAVMAAMREEVDLDHYSGTYDSFREYADQLAGELLACEVADMRNGWNNFHPGPPNDPISHRYFDWEAFARDLRHDYTVIEEGGDVHVFSQ